MTPKPFRLIVATVALLGKWITAVALFCLSCSSFAIDVKRYSDYSTWSSATTEVLVEDWGFPVIQYDQYNAGVDVNLSHFTLVAEACHHNYSIGLGTFYTDLHSNGNDQYGGGCTFYRMDFDQPITAFAAFFSGVGDDGAVPEEYIHGIAATILDQTFTLLPGTEFFGVTSRSPFTSVLFTKPIIDFVSDVDNHAVLDVYFGQGGHLPEPGSLSLLVLLLVVISLSGALRDRRIRLICSA